MSNQMEYFKEEWLKNALTCQISTVPNLNIFSLSLFFNG